MQICMGTKQPSIRELAALTMASTASLVISPCQIVILHGERFFGEWLRHADVHQRSKDIPLPFCVFRRFQILVLDGVFLEFLHEIIQPLILRHFLCHAVSFATEVFSSGAPRVRSKGIPLAWSFLFSSDIQIHCSHDMYLRFPYAICVNSSVVDTASLHVASTQPDNLCMLGMKLGLDAMPYATSTSSVPSMSTKAGAPGWNARSFRHTNRIRLFHSFFKPEHTVLGILINLRRGIRAVRIGMKAVEKLNDMEPAAVHVKVDVPFFKIRCDRLPHPHFRMQPLHRAPSRIVDALAVRLGRDEQQVQIAMLSIHLYDNASGRPACMIQYASPPSMDFSIVSREMISPSSSK